MFLITCNTKKGFVQQYSWKLKVATMSDINQQYILYPKREREGGGGASPKL